MNTTKRNIVKATLISGLVSANKGNPFWTKADAMQTLALFKKNNR